MLVFSGITINYTNNDDPIYEQHALFKNIKVVSLKKGVVQTLHLSALNYNSCCSLHENQPLIKTLIHPIKELQKVDIFF